MHILCIIITSKESSMSTKANEGWLLLSSEPHMAGFSGIA